MSRQHAPGNQLRQAVDACVGLAARGETDRAVAELRRVLGFVNGPPPLLERMGAEMLQIDALAPLAEVAFARWSEIEPWSAMAVARQGAAAAASRAFDRAEPLLRRSIEMDASSVWPRTQLAGLLERTNRLPEAEEAAQEAVKVEPRSAGARLALGQVQRRLGKLAEARASLEAALAAGEGGKPLGPRLEMRVRSELGFTLDQLGVFDEAFAQFERSQAIWLTLPGPSRVDLNAYPARIAAYRELTESTDFGAWPRERPAGSRPAPVFFVGFPRSGTTLLEQLLGAHSRIVAAEEEPFLARAIDEQVREGLAMPSGLAALDESRRARLESRYWALAEASLGPLDGKTLLDKLPLTIVELPAVLRVFPDAKVLVALRDPRDCTLSSFMQEFGANIGMVHTHSLDATARLYEGVMGLWLLYRERLPLAWQETRYEDLVADPEARLREILSFLGLEFEPQVLEGGGRRLSRTPSYRAVGEKIHARATQRFRNYPSQLEAVRSRLEPFLPAFGYGSWQDG